MENVKINFNDKKLTGNAGLVPIGQFANKLNLEAVLAAEISM